MNDVSISWIWIWIWIWLHFVNLNLPIQRIWHSLDLRLQDKELPSMAVIMHSKWWFSSVQTPNAVRVWNDLPSWSECGVQDISITSDRAFCTCNILIDQLLVESILTPAVSQFISRPWLIDSSKRESFVPRAFVNDCRTGIWDSHSHNSCLPGCDISGTKTWAQTAYEWAIFCSFQALHRNQGGPDRSEFLVTTPALHLGTKTLIQLLIKLILAPSAHRVTA